MKPSKATELSKEKASLLFYFCRMMNEIIIYKMK